jgi:hypothetical protein
MLPRLLKLLTNLSNVSNLNKLEEQGASRLFEQVIARAVAQAKGSGVRIEPHWRRDTRCQSLSSL